MVKQILFFSYFSSSYLCVCVQCLQALCCTNNFLGFRHCPVSDKDIKKHGITSQTTTDWCRMNSCTVRSKRGKTWTLQRKTCMCFVIFEHDWKMYYAHFAFFLSWMEVLWYVYQLKWHHLGFFFVVVVEKRKHFKIRLKPLQQSSSSSLTTILSMCTYRNGHVKWT